MLIPHGISHAMYLLAHVYQSFPNIPRIKLAYIYESRFNTASEKHP